MMKGSRLGSLGIVLLLAAAVTGQQQKPEKSGSGEKERARFTPMPVPRGLVKRREKAEIFIDGVLDDWPGGPPLLLDDPRLLSGTALGAWHGPADLAARAFLLWDDDDLYVAVIVRDDWHRALTKDMPRVLEVPPADNVVLTFDPRRDTSAIGRDERRSEDVEFWLADVEGQDRKVVIWDRYRGTARFGEGALATVKYEPEQKLTTYEARLPWKLILPPGTKPKPHMVLDLQIVVNDYDEVTDLMPQTRIGWTFGTGPAIDPGLFGSIMLMGPGELKQDMTEFPEFPTGRIEHGDAVPSPAYWNRFYEKLLTTPPRATGRDGRPPQDVVGHDRLQRLEELEHLYATFPRVDYLSYHMRVHRRMRREAVGMERTGLPYFWHRALEKMAPRVAPPPPPGHLRLFRLPAGGWLVRSTTANFAIDPAGYDLARYLWGAIDFVLLTDPSDIGKRNEQLLLRMAASKKVFYTHRGFHLPGVDVTKMTLAKVGESYNAEGLQVTVVGKSKDGKVSPTVGYAVTWPDGTVLVATGTSATPEEIERAVPSAHRPVDLLLLSAKHPQAALIGQRLAPALTVLDDVLQCSSHAGVGGRVSLEDAFDLQANLRPHPSMIVAPGESTDITMKK